MGNILHQAKFGNWFSGENILYLDYKVIVICSYRSKWTYICIGSYNGWAGNKSLHEPVMILMMYPGQSGLKYIFLNNNVTVLREYW